MKRSKNNKAPTLTPDTPDTPDTPATPIVPPGGTLAITSLQELRDTTLRERFKTNQMIAELDAWRNEIDATIAFLRAQREAK